MNVNEPHHGLGPKVMEVLSMSIVLTALVSAATFSCLLHLCTCSTNGSSSTLACIIIGALALFVLVITSIAQAVLLRQSAKDFNSIYQCGLQWLNDVAGGAYDSSVWYAFSGITSRHEARTWVEVGSPSAES